jgi:selenocysteine lyase/cysteine desulfurase
MTGDERERLIRAEFPAASDTVYLNTAAEGLAGGTMERALNRYAAAKRRGSAGRAELTETASSLKERLARRLECRTGDLALYSSVSEAIGTVLHGLPWEAGDNVVITDLEFPGAMIGCLALSRLIGIDVRVVSHRDGEIETGEIAARIDARTRLVILSHVSFHSGLRFDIEAVTEAAHRQGALILVDASQSLGAVPVAVGDVDFLVACSFKWLTGSHGTALLYARPALDDPLSRHLTGWQGVTDFLGVMRTHEYAPKAGAARYEAGMPNYPAIYALHDALGLLDALDPPWIEARVQRQAGAIRALCCELGLRVLTPADPARRAGIVAFAHPDAQAIGDALAARGVTAWYRDGRLRFSPHVYTSDADVQALRPALTAAVGGRTPSPV